MMRVTPFEDFFGGFSQEVLGWHEGNTISTFFESEGQWYSLWTIHVAHMLRKMARMRFNSHPGLPDCCPSSLSIFRISGMWSARCASSCRIMRWGRGYFTAMVSPDRSPSLTEYSLNSADPDLGTRFFSMFHVFKLSLNMKWRWNIIFPLH